MVTVPYEALLAESENSLVDSWRALLINRILEVFSL